MADFLKRFDMFGSLPDTLREKSYGGSLWSVLGFCGIFFLLYGEISDYFTHREQTLVNLDDHGASELYIHFDVTII